MDWKIGAQGPAGALGRPGRAVIHGVFETGSGFHVFSCEVVHYGKSLSFQGFFTSTNKILIFAVRLGTGLLFYVIYTLS